MTENHSYNKPEAGTTDWHIPLNENFAKIDADVEIRDIDDARSNYTPKSKAKFLATDTGDVYIGDGSNWNHLGNLASDTGDYSTVSAQQIRHKPKETIGYRGIVDRDIVTTEDIEIWVAEDGSDGNPGTSDQPLASVHEAFNRLPFRIQHQVRIRIKPGTYNEGGSIETGMHDVTFVKESGEENVLVVEGTGSNPSDVNITGDIWWNIGISGRVPYRTVFRNFELDGKVQNYGGAFSLRNLIINVGDSHGAGQKSGVDGYEGFTQVKNCTFNTNDEAVYANQGHKIAVGGSDATNAGGAYKERWGGEVWWANSNST